MQGNHFSKSTLQCTFTITLVFYNHLFYSFLSVFLTEVGTTDNILYLKIFYAFFNKNNYVYV